jgi:3-isopropylmalate dehydratase small subunit
MNITARRKTMITLAAIAACDAAIIANNNNQGCVSSRQTAYSAAYDAAFYAIKANSSIARALAFACASAACIVTDSSTVVDAALKAYAAI